MADLYRILTLPDLTVDQLFYELLSEDVRDTRARATERRQAASGGGESDRR